MFLENIEKKFKEVKLHKAGCHSKNKHETLNWLLVIGCWLLVALQIKSRYGQEQPETSNK